MSKEKDDVPIFDKSASGSRMNHEFGFGQYEDDQWQEPHEDELEDDELEFEMNGFSVISRAQITEDRDFLDDDE